MKAHTAEFKNEIKLFGRQIDSKITFGNTVLGQEDLNAVTPHFKSAILKSAMKQLDIDSNVEIPVGTLLKYEFGVKVRDDDVTDYRENYDYINYGNYIVKTVERQEDTNSYRIVCYDKMLYSMLEYTGLTITYPITIRDFINSLCQGIGLEFANKNDTFANYDKVISKELYLTEEKGSLGYTYRDIFDELAAVTASTICINENDELEIRYITETNDVINEDFFKNINVNFGEKFGPVNTLVLSRSGDSDKIYYPSELPANPYELKISDNQIMNDNNRVDFMPDIYEKINGLEFYTNDFVSTGICYYDICDRYRAKIGDREYSCVMFNDEILITQGLVENVFTELPEESQTDYGKADKTDRRINQAYIIVDKQKLEINSVVSRVDDNDDKIDGLGNATEAINGTLATINETILKQTDKQFEMLFKETGIDKTLKDLDDVVKQQNATLDNIKAYIRYGTIDDVNSPYLDSPYIELGKESSQAKIRILNERIQFLTNNEETAYITGNMLYINESTVIWKQIMGKKGKGKWITEIDSYGNQNTYWGGID